jgi:hypothetical protein
MKLPVSLEAETGTSNSDMPVNAAYAKPVMVEIHDASLELAGLPRQGLITFRFRRDEAKVSEHNGHQHIDLKLCLKDVVEVEAEEPEDEQGSRAEDVLDKLFAEAKEDEGAAEEVDDDE